MHRLKITAMQQELPDPEGLYLVILHAGNKPPHMGLMISGLYSSLSIKGKDLDVPAAVLFKNISQRKIASLFVRIKLNPEQTLTSLNDFYKSRVKLFPRVDIGVATCLSPILLFFKDRYGIRTEGVSYLYQLLPRLEEQGLILTTEALFAAHLMSDGEFELPFYTMEEIYKGIEQVRTEYKN
jgi:hypothetical protein